jgi:cysteine desulfurase / selenocysteine lyase
MNIYLDNSATSWPKPPDVVKAVTAFLNECGGSPGRSAHSKSLQSARLVFETRELIADFFNAPSSDKVIFTANATHAINIAIKGILRHGDHVIISAMEHNSVIRPLRQLEESGKISLSILPLNKINGIEESDVEKYVQPDTKLLITTHCSNVNGFVFPVEKIGQICRKNNIIFMVDAAQSAGIIPIDMQAQSIDVLVFTGHKKLYGPTGTGGLCLGKHIEVDALMQGGTGSNSEEEFHPEFYPDKLEAGTLNIAGIAGLNAGILFIQKEGVSKIQNHY